MYLVSPQAMGTQQAFSIYSMLGMRHTKIDKERGMFSNNSPAVKTDE